MGGVVVVVWTRVKGLHDVGDADGWLTEHKAVLLGEQHGAASAIKTNMPGTSR